MKIINIKNVKRLNEGGTLFDCELLIEGRTEYIPYTAKIDSAVYNYIVSNDLDILAYVEPIVPTLTLEQLKSQKISELNAQMNMQYKEYLSKYPEIEIESFKEKARETALVIADNSIPLSQTPYLTKLTQNTTIEERNSLAFAIDVKIQETAQIESYSANVRDLIKSCETVEEIEAIIL